MNRFFNKSAIILLVVSCSFNEIVHSLPNQNGTAPNLMESYAGVIGFAVALITIKEKDKPESTLKVYIKNTSASVKALINPAGTDRGFCLFTIDGNDVKHLMHDPGPVPIDWDKSSLQDRLKYLMRETKARSGSVVREEIAPGEIIVRIISISSSDLTLIKTRPIQISFSVIDPKTSQSYRIDTSPQILTETLEDSP